MILFSKNKKPYKLFLVLGIIILLIIPKSEKYYNNLKISLYDVLLSYDLGFSSLTNILDYENPSKFLVLKKAPRILSNMILGVNRENDLQEININIKFKDYQKILKDRDSSIQKGLGIKFQNVKADIYFNGKRIKSEVSLKGDHPDHWRSLRRMSFKVRIKDENSFLGFKEFTIQKPSARQFPFDVSFQDFQKKMGNISSVSKLVKLNVNGIDWGVMLVEESITKEFLEKLNLKESIVFKFGDEEIWRYENTKDEIYKNYLLSNPYLNFKDYIYSKDTLSELHRKQISYVTQEILKKNSSIYDINSFSKSLILSMAWFSGHSIRSYNSRFYLNPYNLRLYPITTDAGHFGNFTPGLFKIPEFYEKIVNDSIFKMDYKKNYQQVKLALSKSDIIFNKWEDYFPLDEKLNLKRLSENLNFLKDFNIDNFDIIKKTTPRFLRKQFSEENLKEAITKKQVDFLYYHIYARHFENGEIHIYNLLNEKVKIKNLLIDGKTISEFKEFDINGHNRSLDPFILKTNLNRNYDYRIEIETEIKGSFRRFKLGLTHSNTGIYNPIIDETKISEYKFIERDKKNAYIFKKGSWNINSPIVFNGDLIINKGTTINFSSNSYLIVKGSLKILGTEEEKVVLTSSEGFWKGIYVMESKEKSLINNTSFYNLKNLNDGLLDLTGGITFYKSDIDMKNVNFENCIAEDFLNIINSNFNLNNINISKSLSDGFDSDFSNGIIEKSVFKDISGDAVDFSGSEVKIKESIFKMIRDKAISVGEKSKIDVFSSSIDNVGVGVASKDGSKAIITESSFLNFKLYALMTYQKKSFYEKSSLIANQNYFDKKDEYFLRQIGSNLMIDDNYVAEKEINVDTLYESEVMKK